jgi:membrane protease YdiL (CAAX protease family)
MYIKLTLLMLISLEVYSLTTSMIPVKFNTDMLWKEYNHFHVLNLFLISFFQEFLWRAFLIEKLKKIVSKKIIIILTSSVIFSFLHILFTPILIVLPITFIGGIIWSFLYLNYKNILLLTISHMIINFFVIYSCFFTSFSLCVA